MIQFSRMCHVHEKLLCTNNAVSTVSSLREVNQLAGPLDQNSRSKKDNEGNQTPLVTGTRMMSQRVVSMRVSRDRIDVVVWQLNMKWKSGSSPPKAPPCTAFGSGGVRKRDRKQRRPPTMKFLMQLINQEVCRFVSIS